MKITIEAKGDKLYVDGVVYNQPVSVDGELANIQAEYDEFGFSAIQTELGGRKVKAYNEKIAEFLASDDKNKVQAARTAPAYIVVNKDLSTEAQKDGFLFNNNYYFMIVDMSEKRYHSELTHKGAFIVHNFKNYDNSDNDTHLVACASNFSWSSAGENYTKYLKAVEQSAVRWINQRWKFFEELERIGIPYKK